MKKLIIFSIIFIYCLISSAQIPTNGLLYYYPFNGNANDASGNGNNGIVYGPVLTSDRFGNSNSAYSFNGNDDIIATTLNLFNPNPFSLSIWFKTISSGWLMEYTPVQTGLTNQWDRSIWVDSQGKVTFYVYPNSQQFATSTNAYNDNIWHHAVATISSNGMKLYIDGVIAATNPSVINAQSASGYWRFGGHHYAGQSMTAMIDDIRIYNRELTQCEVTYLYNENCNTVMPTANDIHICVSGTGNIIATNGTNYNWYDSPLGCNIIGTDSIYTTPFLSVNDTFWVSNHNNSCESNRIMVIAYVDSLPIVTLNNFNPVCIDTLPFALLGGNPVGGIFSGAGVTGGNFNPSSAGQGTHMIKYTFTDGNGCTNSDSSILFVNNLPIVNITGLDSIYCINATPVVVTGSPNGGLLSGNGIIGNTFNPSIAGNGTYSIVYSYTDVNTCSNTVTVWVTVDPCTGIDDNNEYNFFKIYPNPANDNINIESNSVLQNATLSIYNIQGQLIFQQLLQKTKTTINIENLVKGVYAIKINNQERIIIKRLMKE